MKAASLLERGIQVATLVAAYNMQGITHSDVARQLGLPHATTHRLLRQLMELRMLSKADGTKRFVLGALAYELGLAASTRVALRPKLQVGLERLKKVSGLPVYLFGRSGMESVCLYFTEPCRNDAPITLKTGGRRPLGVGAGGLAILAALSDVEVNEVLLANRRHFGKFGGLTVDRLHELIAETRGLGYSASGGCLNRNTAAVGMTLHGSYGNPIGAVSISSTVHRLRVAEREHLAKLLREAAPRLTM